MHLYHDSGRHGRDGFIYVASLTVLYYELAIFSAQSLRDYHPNAYITLFTHEKFVDKRALEIFDRIYTEIPIHKRAKMWGMARTPYERTIYIDCDSQIMHRDIKLMHDFLDDCDLFCGSNPKHTVANPKWAWIDKAQTIEIPYHGSMWGYDNSALKIDFMQTWFDEYIKQDIEPWDKYEEKHYYEWKQFDMFTLWRLTLSGEQQFERFKDLKIQIVPRRFNCSMGDGIHLDKPPVLMQIPRTVWKTMPHIWEIIERGIKDETRAVEKSETPSFTFRYN